MTPEELQLPSISELNSHCVWCMHEGRSTLALELAVNDGFRGRQLPSISELISHCVWCMLASFPGSRVGGEKRAWYTLFAHAQFSQDFWEFGNSRKICSVTLTSARHADFSRIKDACH